MNYVTTIDGKEFQIEILDEHRVRIGDRIIAVDFESISGQPVFSLIVDGKSYESYVYQSDEGWQVLLHGRQFEVTVEDEREKRLKAAAGGGVAEGGELHLKAPMPGLVVAVPVTEGQEVKKGQVLVILESMKMQNELKAPRDGLVARISAQIGASVEQGKLLVTIV